MAKLLPFFKWYPSDAETDENFRMMDDSQVGFYLRCLNHCWINGGLPADAEMRARALRVDKKYHDRQWPIVGRCFVASELEPDRLINPRQEEERAKAMELSKKRSTGGSARAKQMWSKSDSSANSSAIRHLQLRASESVCVSGSSFSEERGSGGEADESNEWNIELCFQAYQKIYPQHLVTRIADCRAAYAAVVLGTADPVGATMALLKHLRNWNTWCERNPQKKRLGLLNFLHGGDCMRDPPEQDIAESEAIDTYARG